MLNDNPIVCIDRDNNADGDLAFRHFARFFTGNIPKREAYE
jgi:hypothetical protein